MIRYGTPAGRWVLTATILGSGMALLDTTFVNVALPSIAADLDAGFSGLQWTVDAYLLTLGSLLLFGGSLGDVFGRRRVFLAGVAGFTVASILCGLAPTIGLLVTARALQGAGAALMVPASLAIIAAVFDPGDRGQAIGAWSGLSGVAAAIGPFVGGWLVDAGSWRLAFLLNVPFAVLVWFAARRVPETRDEQAPRRLDVAGAVTVALALGGLVFALIEAPVRGWSAPPVVAAVIIGVVALAAFVVTERRVRAPMLPFALLRNRQFSAANVVTLALYAALSTQLFLLSIQLQTVLAYSALEAGAAALPVTGLLIALSPTAGRVSQRVGPRVPMTVGPLVAGCGIIGLAQVSGGSAYLSGVLPWVVVFGLGLASTVAPLTTTALSAVASNRAGIASGVNNAVARLAGLVGVAVIPLAAGIADVGSVAFSAGFARAMLIAGALCLAAGLFAWATVRSDREVPIAHPA